MSTGDGFRCNKCGYRMTWAGEHDTTAGCPVGFNVSPGFVSVFPTIWGSEEARKILRYDEAIRLLDEAQWELDGEHSPETVKRIKAFLAAEPKEGKGGR